MANFATVDTLQFPMDDLNQKSQPKQPKKPKHWLKSGDSKKREKTRIDKYWYKEFTTDVGKDLASKGSKGLKDDKVTKLIAKIERQNENAKSQPTATKKAPEKIIIPSEFRDSDSDSDSDNDSD